MSECNHENDMDGQYGQEMLEPLRMTFQETSDDVQDNNVNDPEPNKEGQPKNNAAAKNANEGDDGSEDNNPRRGRPGIVVFSGGTAFNAASAEMASRSVGWNGGVDKQDDSEAISRSNSVSSLMDLMTMGSTESAMINSNQNQHTNTAGGTKVWHVLPVTDDGGSTAEIVRVLGGPAVGDIRSRLLRLAPGTNREARAVRRLLGHRLVSMQSFNEKKKEGSSDEVTHDVISRMAREEWLDILDGGHESYQQSTSHHLDEDDDDNSESNIQQNYEHPLWKDVSNPYRSIIRAYLVHFHNLIMQTHNGIRQSPANPPFDFTGGSVGNFFFAGSRTFFGSLPAAIFLFSKVAEIPSGSRVIPAVLSEERLVLGAVLKDGSRIRGQYKISHPQPKLTRLQQTPKPQSFTPRHTNRRERSGSGSSISRHRQVVKSSLDISSLHASPMSRIAFLLNDPTWRRDVQRNQSLEKNAASPKQWSDRHEVSPEINPLVLDAISNANCIVYGCGSLFTSVLPSLVLDGVGSAISSRNVHKVLLLNGWHDYETSWTESSGSDDGERLVKQMDATAFAKAVVDALDQGDSTCSRPLVTNYITHLFYPIGTEIKIDEQSLASFCMTREQQPQRQKFIDIQVRGIKSIPADTCSEGSRSGGQSHHSVFDPRALVDALLELASEEKSSQR